MDSLISDIEWWETVSKIGIWMVIFGVAGEGLELFSEIVLHWHFKEKFLKRFELAAWALVVFGLVVEMQAGVKLSIINGEIQTILRTQADMAIERTSLVESTNLLLRKELLELQAAVQWRTITPAQQAIVADKLIRGVKGPVAVQEDWTDAEAGRFGERILTVLRDAGFEHRVANAQIIAMRHPGVLMFVKSLTNAPPHATLIQQAFMEIGVVMDARNAFQAARMEDVFTGSNSNLVLIWVSQKP